MRHWCCPPPSQCSPGSPGRLDSQLVSGDGHFKSSETFGEGKWTWNFLRTDLKVHPELPTNHDGTLQLGVLNDDQLLLLLLSEGTLSGHYEQLFLKY